MTRLVWNQNSDRYYEFGVDRGLIQSADGEITVWNGLISVEENDVAPTDIRSHFDGVAYLNLRIGSFYQSNVKAYGFPDSFVGILGEKLIRPGFSLAHQPRERFNFAYRTKVGTNHYKLHLVYNALATVTNRGSTSFGSSPIPNELGLRIDAMPPTSIGYRPSSHIVIDSRRTQWPLFTYIEGLLYGTATTEPSFPTQEELRDLFSSQGPILRTNLILNPRQVATGSMAEIKPRFSWTLSHGVDGDRMYARVTRDAGSVAAGFSRGFDWYQDPQAATPATTGDALLLPVTAGQSLKVRYDARCSLATNQVLMYRIHNGTGTWLMSSANLFSRAINSTWSPSTNTSITILHTGYICFGNRINASAYGVTDWFDQSHLYISLVLDDYFDGYSDDTADESYEWAGTPDNSYSIARRWG